MKILIWGAGGIGCYYGARLQNSGNQVTYVARGEHLNALQSQGLKLSHPEFYYSGDVSAISEEQLISQRHSSDFDLIILAFKSTSTEESLIRLADWLKCSDTPILSLQNGVDNEQIISSLVGAERTVGGLAVRIGGHIITPGVVEAKGVAQVIYGQWPNSRQHENVVVKQLGSAFAEAGIEAFQSSDVQKELWRKLMINNAVNPLSVLTEWDSRKVTSHPVYGKTVYSIMQETARAAAADNVDITEKDVDEMFALISGFDAIKTSMLVDYEKGRPLELEGISGPVIKRCKTLSIDCPFTKLISSLVRTKVGQ